MSLDKFAGPFASLVIKGIDLITIKKEKKKYRRIYIQKIKKEITGNLNLLKRRNDSNVLKEKLIGQLKDTAMLESVIVELDYNLLASKKSKRVEKKHISRKKEEICIGWDCNKLIDKITDKITDLKDYTAIVKDINKNKSALTQRLDNLYYQLVLIGNLIREEE